MGAGILVLSMTPALLAAASRATTRNCHSVLTLPGPFTLFFNMEIMK